MLRGWLARAVPALEAARERIDAVNVFPVPDGDTGTNVLLTVRGAADEVVAAGPGADGPAVLRALARGALLSARGNSGVILSRYLGGLVAAGSAPLPEALRQAAVAARSAVPEPQDGTVLTVAAVVAEAAGAAHGPGADDAAVLAAGVAAGRADLGRISAAHPVLSSARVVDAGGAALLVLLDALAGALAGSRAAVDLGWLPAPAATPGDGHHDPAPTPAAGAGAAAGTGTPGYEVVALLRAADASAAERLAATLSGALAAVGDAVAVVAGDGPVTAHVHAARPADVTPLLAAGGARWTATVRTLLGAARPVVACTASAGSATLLADAGAVAVVLPDGVPADEARAAVARAVQDALAPVHARPGPGAAGPAAVATTAGGTTGTGGAASTVAVGPDPTAVTVLPGDRLAPADLDPAWTVPAGACDDAGVLAALSAPAPSDAPGRNAVPGHPDASGQSDASGRPEVPDRAVPGRPGRPSDAPAEVHP